MTFTVEDGTGLAAANAYVSLADADAYHLDRGAAAWAAATDADKQAAIVRATTWVDATYRARFSGKRVNGRAQGLEWPRVEATDAAGDAVADGAVPAEIEMATSEAALREIEAPNSLQPDVVPGNQKILVAVNGLRWQSRASAGASSQKPVLHVVDGILAPLLGADTGRLLRA